MPPACIPGAPGLSEWHVLLLSQLKEWHVLLLSQQHPVRLESSRRGEGNEPLDQRLGSTRAPGDLVPES